MMPTVFTMPAPVSRECSAAPAAHLPDRPAIPVLLSRSPQVQLAHLLRPVIQIAPTLLLNASLAEASNVPMKTQRLRLQDRDETPPSSLPNDSPLARLRRDRHCDPTSPPGNHKLRARWQSPPGCTPQVSQDKTKHNAATSSRGNQRYA